MSPRKFAVNSRIKFMWILTRELVREYGVTEEELPKLYEIQRLLAQMLDEEVSE